MGLSILKSELEVQDSLDIVFSIARGEYNITWLYLENPMKHYASHFQHFNRRFYVRFLNFDPKKLEKGKRNTENQLCGCRLTSVVVNDFQVPSTTEDAYKDDWIVLKSNWVIEVEYKYPSTWYSDIRVPSSTDEYQDQQLSTKY